MQLRPPSKIFAGFLRRILLLAFGALLLTALCTETPVTSARAQNVERVVAKRVKINWLAAAQDAQDLSPHLSAPAASQVFGAKHDDEVAKRLEEYAIKDSMLPLAHLGQVARALHAGIATTPIPVLAPVDSGHLVAERIRAGHDATLTPQSFFRASIESMQFVPGSSGYDALVTISPRLLRDLNIALEDKPLLEIAGTFLSYDDDDYGEIVADLQDLYPGLRRLPGAEEVTYTFKKYGVPYFINVACSDNPPRL